MNRKTYKTQWIASYEEFGGYFPPKFPMEVRKEACETTLDTSSAQFLYYGVFINIFYGGNVKLLSTDDKNIKNR